MVKPSMKTKLCLILACMLLSLSAFAQTQSQQVVNATTATVSSTGFDTRGVHQLGIDWKFGTVVGSYTTCTVQAKTTFDGTNYLTLGSAVTVTVTSGQTNAWTLAEPLGTSVSSTAANSFGTNTLLTFACSGYGTSAPAAVSVMMQSIPGASSSGGGGGNVQGTLADNVTNTANPVIIGGTYNGTNITRNIQTDSAGRVIVIDYGSRSVAFTQDVLGNATPDTNIANINGDAVVEAATGIQLVGIANGTGTALTSTNDSGNQALNVHVTGGSTGNGAASNTGAAVPAQADYIGAKNAVGGLLIGVTAHSDGTGEIALDHNEAQFGATAVVLAGTPGLTTTAGGVVENAAPAPSQGTYRSLSLTNAGGARTDTSTIAGVTVATAAAGIQKVGVTDGTGTAITSTGAAIDVNLKTSAASNISMNIAQVGGTAAVTCGTSGCLGVGIRDAAGNARGANVTASNELLTNVNNTVTVAAHNVTNAGTFATQSAVTAASGAIASGAVASGAVASGAFASGSISDGAEVTLGSKADAKSTATDTTAITIMQVLKEISAMVQAPASTPVKLSDNSGTALNGINNKLGVALFASDGTTPITAVSDPCDGTVPLNANVYLTTAGVVIPASNGKKTVICGGILGTDTNGATMTWVSGTGGGSGCGSTVTYYVGTSGGVTKGFPLTGFQGFVLPAGHAYYTSATSMDTCLQTNGNQTLVGSIWYQYQGFPITPPSIPFDVLIGFMVALYRRRKQIVRIVGLVILGLMVMGGCPDLRAQNPFTTLCAQSGVISCTTFDSSADIPNNGDSAGAGNWKGIASFKAGNAPVIDNTIYANGSGSLMFTLPASSNAGDPGLFYSDFTSAFDHKQTGGSEFWVQWRQRFDNSFITTVYSPGDGWKQAWLSTGDTSGTHYSGCVDNVLVVQNTNHKEWPQMYDACVSHGTWGAFDNLWSDNSGVVQISGGNNTAADNNREQTATPFCRTDSGPPFQNCQSYFANEWMTFKLHIILGTLVSDEWTNSTVQLYVARANQAGALAVNLTGLPLAASATAAQQNIGKVVFTPYDTNRTSGTSYTTTYTWYDDLIISSNDISMTYGNSVPSTSITAPSPGVVTGITAVTASGTSTNGATVTQVQFQIDGQNLGSAVTMAPYTTNLDTSQYSAGTHLLTSIVTDSNGATATSSPISVTINPSAASASGILMRLRIGR